jgi:hypothetical protein
VPSTRISRYTFVSEEFAKVGQIQLRIVLKGTKMAIQEDSNEVIPTFDDSYYEERASVEEIYLEEIEEELRAVLISVPNETIVAHRSDNSPAETAVNSNRNDGAKSCQQ